MVACWRSGGGGGISKGAAFMASYKLIRESGDEVTSHFRGRDCSKQCLEGGHCGDVESYFHEIYPSSPRLRSVSAGADTAASKSTRLLSLDVFRGLAVLLMILVDDLGGIIPVINHSPWNGLTLADFVMPFFLFMVGVSLGLVYKTVSCNAAATKKVIWRTLKLFILGIILQGGFFHGINNLTYGVDLKLIRWMGVLQRIAAAYFVAAMCEIWLRNDEKVNDGVSLLKKYQWHWTMMLMLTAVYIVLLYGLYVPDWEYQIPYGVETKIFRVKCGMRGDTGETMAMATISTSSSPVVPSLVLLLSLPVLFFIVVPKFLPPRQIAISLPDELDDLSLFHKAIAMDSANFSRRHVPHFPSAKSHFSASLRRPKIAFLFLTDSPLHFAPLWERFFSNVTTKHYNIYVHADPSVKITLDGVFMDRNIPSKRTQRSSPTLISAARRLLATAMLADPSNTYFALVSQYCIPLHSFEYLYNSLFDLVRLSRGLELPSYIEILDDEPNLWERYNSRGNNVMLPEVSFEDFRLGSQFFVLTRKHSLMVIKDRKLWRKFKLPCLDVESCHPEKHYFPTLLAMQDPKSCTGYTLTRVNWTDTLDGHPHTYNPSEVSPDLIYRLRESNSSYSYMFARKFSPDCLDPLMDILDSVILND